MTARKDRALAAHYMEGLRDAAAPLRDAEEHLRAAGAATALADEEGAVNETLVAAGHLSQALEKLLRLARTRNQLLRLRIDSRKDVSRG